MILTESQLKAIIRESIQHLTEGRLASSILASERVMDELSKQYAEMYRSQMNDQQIRKEMIYFLEQNCGVCERPDAIAKALREIWDKIQTGATKYGYSGQISKPQTENELSDYLKAKAAKLVADEKLMGYLGSSYYFAKERGRVGRAMSPKNEWSMPNMMINAPEFKTVLGYLTFEEAKMIIKYLGKEIKAAAKEYAGNRKAKEAEITESVYNDVIKKLKLNG